MTRPRERTLTALLSTLGRGEGAHVPLLLGCGRADGLGAAPFGAVPVGEGLHIGRGPAGEPGEGAPGPRQLLLDDPLVSGHHAHISRGGGGYEVRDAGSKNGTFVDGQRVAGTAALADGARLFVGNHAFVFRQALVTDLEALDEERAAPLGPVATTSPAMSRLCHRLRRLATTEAELLLAGETGVGKEVYARAVHAASGRAGPFVAINCAALPRDLVESELFGYRSGAHSTAHGHKAGLLEDAEGGTLLLDEIGEMSQDAQAKLLRFLQDKQLVPLGSTRPRRLDVRVIAATNRPVGPGNGSGLRDDLLARLGASPLRLPPLRERIEDLGRLIAHFAGRSATAAVALELGAFRALVLYRWPLNVRELEKVLLAAFALTGGRRPIERRDLPDAIGEPASAGDGTAAPPPRAAARAGRKSPEPAPGAEELELLLAQHGGRVADVARALGRQRAAVWRWIKLLGLEPEKFRPRSR
jgi:sigma-54 dependent transcriptional regulator, acetoin dehydrogenase operon transcriptional activator AcoR